MMGIHSARKLFKGSHIDGGNCWIISSACRFNKVFVVHSPVISVRCIERVLIVVRDETHGIVLYQEH